MNYLLFLALTLALLSIARAQEEVGQDNEEHPPQPTTLATRWDPSAEAASSRAVIKRLLGEKAASRFRFTITRAQAKIPTYEKDQYSVEAMDGVVYVNGTTGVALCVGAYQYLKRALGVQVTWGEDGSGDQIQTALRFVTAGQKWPDFKLTNTALVPLRYGWNMCTFSYTAVWWNETRWQREVDWMALHGINMPLAVTGVEYVWKKVFVDKYKVPLEDLQEWFSGPAFLTWQRMGNLRAFGGPLSLQWINRQKDLNVFILKQMRDLGMKPVLSCFAGHVPEAAKSLFPNAQFARSESWAGFSDKYTGVWHMTPTSKDYQTLGEDFMRAQQEAYGETEFYNCDTFNEVDPHSEDPAELSAAAAAVTSTIKGVNPNGIWVMQGWLFYFSGFWRKAINVENYLKGAKNEDMIVLDLVSEQVVVAERHVNRNYEYYGKKWIYNMLHNFGGVHGIYGNMHKMFTEVPKKNCG